MRAELGFQNTGNCAPDAADNYRQMIEEQDKVRIPPSIVLPNIETPRLPPEEGTVPNAPAQTAPAQSPPAQ